MYETRVRLRRKIAHRELMIDSLRERVAELEAKTAALEAPRAMSQDEAKQLQAKLAETPDPTCIHCGGLHSHKCWRIKKMDHDGSVEYWKAWDKSTTVWPEDVLAVVMQAQTPEN